MSSIILPLIQKLAGAAVGAAAKAYGSTAHASLVPSTRTKVVRAIFFQPTGMALVQADLEKTLAPWLASERLSSDAITEGLQSVIAALSTYEPDAAALDALADPEGLFRQLQAITAGPMGVDGARDVFEFSLRQVIASLRSMAPRADGMTGKMLASLVERVGLLGRENTEMLTILRRLDEERTTTPDGTGSFDEDLDHTSVLLSLSEARIARYRQIMGSDVGALRLYTWNIEMSAELYRGLHFTEVVLRNAIDRQLREHNSAKESGTPDWGTHPNSLIARVFGRSIREATARLEADFRVKGRLPIHDDLVAQMTFGAWRYCLPRSKRAAAQRTLWRQCLHAAFPQIEIGDGLVLATHVDNLGATRNRIAHLEPMLDGGRNRRDMRSMLYVLSAVDPAAADYYLARQAVTTLLRQRPQPELREAHGVSPGR